MASGTLLYGSPTALTITLASLAHTNGQVCDILNIQTSNKAPGKLLFHYKIKTSGTPTNGGTIEFFWARADRAGSNIDGNLASTNTNYTSTASALRDMLKAVHAQVVTSTAGTYYGSFVIDVPGAQGSLYVYNNTGQALDSTGGNHSITYETITVDIS